MRKTDPEKERLNEIYDLLPKRKKAQLVNFAKQKLAEHLEESLTELQQCLFEHEHEKKAKQEIQFNFLE